jgi:hypothetical protein
LSNGIVFFYFFLQKMDSNGSANHNPIARAHARRVTQARLAGDYRARALAFGQEHGFGFYAARNIGELEYARDDMLAMRALDLHRTQVIFITHDNELVERRLKEQAFVMGEVNRYYVILTDQEPL